MPKVSVEDKVLAILKSNEWVASSEIEKLFPAGEPGHFSWPQRLRGLREPQNGGYTIEHRIKAGTKNLSEWHLIQPSAPTIAQIKAETAQGGPKTPQTNIGLRIPDIKVPRPAFMTQSGQFSFIG